jgi:hypothetical protein
MRHQAGVIDQNVNPSELLHSSIDQFLHLVTVGDVRHDRQCLAPTTDQLVR